MTTLGLIPARGGSKGIPGKNIKPLAGVPPVVRAVETAVGSGVLDRVLVSSDSMPIVEAATAAGAEAPFVRPDSLSTDNTPMLAVVQHAVEFLQSSGWIPDVVVLLQPTAPLRRPEDVQQAIAMLESSGADSVVSVTRVPDHFSPYWMLRLENGYLSDVVPGGRTIGRRQDLPDAFIREGTVYAVRTSTVLDGSLYGERSLALEIPPERALNLDTEEDWIRAERLLSERAR